MWDHKVPWHKTESCSSILPFLSVRWLSVSLTDITLHPSSSWIKSQKDVWGLIHKQQKWFAKVWSHASPGFFARTVLLQLCSGPRQPQSGVPHVGFLPYFSYQDYLPSSGGITCSTNSNRQSKRWPTLTTWVHLKEIFVTTNLYHRTLHADLNINSKHAIRHFQRTLNTLWLNI